MRWASGIFDFKDDNLLICYSIEGDRPTELRTTTDRPDEVLMILKADWPVMIQRLLLAHKALMA